jgi:hypothetical protein
MPEEVMIVSIVAIGCATGVVLTLLNTIRAAFTRRAVKGQDELVGELRSLREEVKQLRQQNNDVILNFDTTLQRVDRRLTHLETSRLSAGVQEQSPAETPAQLIGRAR